MKKLPIINSLCWALVGAGLVLIIWTFNERYNKPDFPVYIEDDSVYTYHVLQIVDTLTITKDDFTSIDSTTLIMDLMDSKE